MQATLAFDRVTVHFLFILQQQGIALKEASISRKQR